MHKGLAVDKYVHVLSLQEIDVVGEQKAAKVQPLISELC